MNVFVFDIETVPDLDNGRKILDLPNIPDEEVAEAMTTMRRMKVGHTFMPHHLQKIVAISIVWHHPEWIKVWSLGESCSEEKELIQRFFTGIEKHAPILVSWNGTNFDLPVLHYRALLHGITANRYWEIGEEDPRYKYNNYLNRYHYRHMDLLDILAGYSPKNYAPLDEIARMMNLPGKISLHGSEVFHYYQRGEIDKIRNYCELDVLNTYLIYLRFELMRGQIDDQQYDLYQNNLKDMLKHENKEHFQHFLDAWQNEP